MIHRPRRRRPPAIRYRRRVAYYTDPRMAAALVASMRPIWPEARAVLYGLGEAIQKNPGGPYWRGAGWTGD